MSILFSPITLGSQVLDNRVVIAPMCQYSADEGRATDWHQIHLGHLALSGAGLMFIEATAVAPEGRISPADLGLWSDETEAALAHVLQSIRRHSRFPSPSSWRMPAARPPLRCRGPVGSRSRRPAAAGKPSRRPPCPMRQTTPPGRPR